MCVCVRTFLRNVRAPLAVLKIVLPVDDSPGSFDEVFRGEKSLETGIGLISNQQERTFFFFSRANMKSFLKKKVAESIMPSVDTASM